MILTPAYGRNYTSASEAVEAFQSGRHDFILNDPSSRWNGKPCSSRDFPPGTQVIIRYHNLRRVVNTTVQEQSK